jgi:hypothetical protein
MRRLQAPAGVGAARPQRLHAAAGPARGRGARSDGHRPGSRYSAALRSLVSSPFCRAHAEESAGREPPCLPRTPAHRHARLAAGPTPAARSAGKRRTPPAAPATHADARLPSSHSPDAAAAAAAPRPAKRARPAPKLNLVGASAGGALTKTPAEEAAKEALRFEACVAAFLRDVGGGGQQEGGGGGKGAPALHLGPAAPDSSSPWRRFEFLNSLRPPIAKRHHADSLSRCVPPPPPLQERPTTTRRRTAATSPPPLPLFPSRLKRCWPLCGWSARAPCG